MVYCFTPTCNHSSKSSVLKDISFLGSYTTFKMADGARDWQLLRHEIEVRKATLEDNNCCAPP